MKKKEILNTLPRTRAQDVRALVSRGISQPTLIACYALYKGEKLIDVGTADELARNNDVSEITIRVRMCPAYQCRIGQDSNALRVFYVNMEQKPWGRCIYQKWPNLVKFKTMNNTRAEEEALANAMEAMRLTGLCSKETLNALQVFDYIKQLKEEKKIIERYNDEL